jgi:hypothetical protein
MKRELTARAGAGLPHDLNERNAHGRQSVAARGRTTKMSWFEIGVLVIGVLQLLLLLGLLLDIGKVIANQVAYGEATGNRLSATYDRNGEIYERLGEIHERLEALEPRR